MLVNDVDVGFSSAIAAKLKGHSHSVKMVLTTRPAFFRAAFGFRSKGTDFASTGVTRENPSKANACFRRRPTKRT